MESTLVNTEGGRGGGGGGGSWGVEGVGWVGAEEDPKEDRRTMASSQRQASPLVGDEWSSTATLTS